MSQLKAGFVGLGNLGSAIARRLLDQGVELTVWNRTASKARDLHARVAVSPEKLCGTNKVILLILFDSDAVDEVLRGPNGILRVEYEGHLIIETTTNHFSRVEDFIGQLKQGERPTLKPRLPEALPPPYRGT